MTFFYKVELQHTYYGEVGYNIFTYLSNEGFSPSVLASLFIEHVVSLAIGISNTSLEYTGVKITDWRNELAPVYWGAMTGFTGTRTGGGMPSYGAWGYFLQRGSGNVRSGGKRFGGVNEADTAGQIPQAFFVDNLEALEPRLSAVLTDGARKYYPMIYRPENPDAGVTEQAAQIVGAQYRRLTTQNSRKVGRGAAAGFNLVADQSYDLTSFAPLAGSDWVSFGDWVATGGERFYTDGVVDGEPNVVTFA